MAASTACTFEQQASTVYVNTLILQALRATGRIRPEQEARFGRSLRLASQDLLGHQRDDGGFVDLRRELRGHTTAYGLFVLSQLVGLTYVDPAVLDRAREVPAGLQEGNGGFGGPTETAYIAQAMLAADPECLATEDPTKKRWPAVLQRARSACRRVVQRLVEAFGVVAGVDSYTLAWAADGLVAAGPANRAQADALLDELDSRGTIVGRDRDRRVTWRSRQATLYGARGLPAEVETTAVIAHALITHGGRPDKAREAVRSLLGKRTAD